MSRSLWKGNISFGLITIPVAVVSAQSKKQSLDFDLLDKRDKAHVGYQKINKKTGKEIDKEQIVKGLKLASGQYAIFEQGELNRFKIKGTNSIDIQQFVEREKIDPIYFKKFYYLEPGKDGNKTYVLLRETLIKTDKFAVGLIVIHNRQHLVLIGANRQALILHVLYYAQELKDLKEIETPAAGLKSTKVSNKEIAMAERLVEDLTEKWKPTAFKDNYIQQIKRALKSKSRKKVVADEDADHTETTENETMAKVLDLMPLLEKSLKKKSKSKPRKKSVAHRRSS